MAKAPTHERTKIEGVRIARSTMTTRANSWIPAMPMNCMANCASIIEAKIW